jgi:trigger factor
MEVGQKGQVFVDFAGDFQAPAVAGKKATYFVDVKAIRNKVLPELDEQMLEVFGVKAESELREKVEADLLGSAESQESQRLKSELLKTLMGKTKMDLPESVVAEETRSAVYDMVRRTAARGASQQQIESQREEIFKAAHLGASDKVKARYLLNAIAAEENIDSSDDEVTERVRSIAQYYGVPEGEMRKRLEQDNMLEGIASQIRVDKTLDFLLAEAKIKE